jgi:hypothetical protein
MSGSINGIFYISKLAGNYIRHRPIQSAGHTVVWSDSIVGCVSRKSKWGQNAMVNLDHSNDSLDIKRLTAYNLLSPSSLPTTLISTPTFRLLSCKIQALIGCKINISCGKSLGSILNCLNIRLDQIKRVLKVTV